MWRRSDGPDLGGPHRVVWAALLVLVIVLLLVLNVELDGRLWPLR